MRVRAYQGSQLVNTVNYDLFCLPELSAANDRVFLNFARFRNTLAIIDKEMGRIPDTSREACLHSQHKIRGGIS